MPLEWKCIVKSGRLVKSPPMESLNRRWKIRYFVLYDPNLAKNNSFNGNLCKPRASTYTGKQSSGGSESESTAQVVASRKKQRRKSSIIQRFQQSPQSFDVAEFTTPMLFVFDDCEKEMQGYPPRSEYTLYAHNVVSTSLQRP